jgi:hypothetical protein
VQHEQDPLQRQAIGQSLSARIAKAPFPLRQQGLDELPQLVGDDPRCDGDRHHSRLDNGCREHTSAPRSKTLENVLEDRLGGLGVPVLYGLPLGHGASLATLPLGVEATVDADALTLTIDEPALLTS